MNIRDIIQWGSLFTLFGFDQISKGIAIDTLVQNDLVITSFFRFHLTFNQGIAFSIPMPMSVLLFLTALFLGGLVWWFLSQKPLKWESWGLVFLIAGGLGNFIDRLLRGEVVDFLSFWSFPVFNMADMYINVGIAFLVWANISEYKKKYFLNTKKTD